MDNSDLPRLAYMALLVLAIAGWFLAENRMSLGKTLRMALAWGLIFLGAIAGVGLWSDIRRDVIPRQSVIAEGSRIEVPRAFDGHYYLRLLMNGEPVDVVVDTGASDLVLTREDAARIGIPLQDLVYTGRAMTANGSVRIASARVDEVRLGGIIDRNVRVSINEGEMPGSLLGMSYLQRFDRIEITDGMLVLER